MFKSFDKKYDNKAEEAETERLDSGLQGSLTSQKAAENENSKLNQFKILSDLS